MAFQIHNADNKPLSMHKLDQQIAAFWQVSIHPKRYCSPVVIPADASPLETFELLTCQTNWFDMIGYAISSTKATTWQPVRDYLYDVLDAVSEADKNKWHESPFVGPHFKLIDYFETLGYQPLGY